MSEDLGEARLVGNLSIIGTFGKDRWDKNILAVLAILIFCWNISCAYTIKYIYIHSNIEVDIICVL